MNLAPRKRSLEVHFKTNDPRFPTLTSRFEAETIEKGYRSLVLRNPAEVEELLSAIRQAEVRGV